MRIELNLRHNAQFYHFLASYPGQFALSGRWRHIQNCRGRLGTRLSRVDSRKRITTIVWTRIDWCVFNDNENALGTGNDLSPGGRAEDLGLNKVKFSRSPLWILLHWSDPPNNVWCLSRSSPPCLHFPSKFEWSPLDPSKVFSDPPFRFSAGAHQTGSQFSADPPFCSPTNQVITPKIPSPPSPPQAINNDRFSVP